eukprot:CAMPEP_0114675532 /NCGR_PEP_ID=MMETSP0191-20121206/48006_1 /TAXON_ID=126664 /ORGANISM="Sorites sp." /LENGTH=508 /DNA_ID=CAMNT_0001944977 /DNA_START=193 /DNA_END=1719 /DNA_ORIENTATION=-
MEIHYDAIPELIEATLMNADESNNIDRMDNILQVFDEVCIRRRLAYTIEDRETLEAKHESIANKISELEQVVIELERQRDTIVWLQKGVQSGIDALGIDTESEAIFKSLKLANKEQTRINSLLSMISLSINDKTNSKEIKDKFDKIIDIRHRIANLQTMFEYLLRKCDSKKYSILSRYKAQCKKDEEKRYFCCDRETPFVLFIVRKSTPKHFSIKKYTFYEHRLTSMDVIQSEKLLELDHIALLIQKNLPEPTNVKVYVTIVSTEQEFKMKDDEVSILKEKLKDSVRIFENLLQPNEIDWTYMTIFSLFNQYNQYVYQSFGYIKFDKKEDKQNVYDVIVRKTHIHSGSPVLITQNSVVFYSNEDIKMKPNCDLFKDEWRGPISRSGIYLIKSQSLSSQLNTGFSLMFDINEEAPLLEDIPKHLDMIIPVDNGRKEWETFSKFLKWINFGDKTRIFCGEDVKLVKAAPRTNTIFIITDDWDISIGDVPFKFTDPDIPFLFCATKFDSSY